MLAAQHAAIGATICTIRASRMIGNNFRKYRRITTTTSWRPLTKHAGRGVSRSCGVRFRLTRREYFRNLGTSRASRSRSPLPWFPQARLFQPLQPPTPIPNAVSCIPGMQPNRQNREHFANCSNFEQWLPKLVTRRKRWSTSAASDQPQGCSLVVQVSGGALARTSSVAPSIKIKSKFSGK